MRVVRHAARLPSTRKQKPRMKSGASINSERAAKTEKKIE